MKNSIALLLTFFCLNIFAHPLPNTVVNIKVQQQAMLLQVKVPLQDFEIAFKDKIKPNQTEIILNYFRNHIKVEDKNKQFLKIELVNFKIQKTKAEMVGEYDEVIFNLRCIANKNTTIRNFTLHYDAIMHEIVNNQAMIYVTSDWENGIHESQQIGIIGLDVPTNTIYPLHVSLEKGSYWKGFKSMVSLGMKHISEGTDHLLFLLLLLLSAPLIVEQKKWIANSSTKYALTRIFKIVTAFTIGHSITLLIGSFGWLQLSIKWVEITIAFSILITAVHAIKPIFYNKEIYIASLFGLIHGLAFATILTALELDTNKLAISLLGFNIGIELMQLFVISITIPWFLLLSQNIIYKWIRYFITIVSGIVAIAWSVERYTEKPNFISIHTQNTINYSLWIILGLAIFSITHKIIFVYKRKHAKNSDIISRN